MSSQSLTLRIIYSITILILVPKTYIGEFLAISIIKPDLNSNIWYDSNAMKLVWSGSIMMRLVHIFKFSRILFKKWDYYDSKDQMFQDSLGPLVYEFLGTLVLLYICYDITLKKREIVLKKNDDDDKKSI